MLKLKETKEKLDQYENEAAMWIRSLDYSKQENNHLRNRLTEVVDKTSDKYFLAQAEHFQNQFIIKDEFMDELRHDINEQVSRLKDRQHKNAAANTPDHDLSELQNNLREQVHYLEKDFTSLRNEFHQYLTEQIWT